MAETVRHGPGRRRRRRRRHSRRGRLPGPGRRHLILLTKNQMTTLTTPLQAPVESWWASTGLNGSKQGEIGNLKAISFFSLDNLEEL